MKAVQITEAGKVQVADIVKPTLGAGEILLRIKYVGFCGSDLNTYLGRNPMVKMPVIPGHEVGAVIEEIGEGVPAGFEKGMNVTVNPYTNCGKCASCRNGRVNACEHNETLGVQRNGSMQEFLVLPWTKVIPATGLSDKECALIEPMSVGFHAVSRAQVTDIDTVAVIGCGMIGLGAIVRASLRGARVIAMDIDDEKLELAKRLGASMVINSKTENVVERVRELTDGYMADVVIEAVGSPVTYVTAIDIVAFTGRVACIGYAKSEVAFQTKYFVQKELDIRGSRNAMPEDFRAVIHYLQNGNCPMNELISAVVKPEEAGEALQKWSENPGKVFRMLVEF
ncbi:MULTISPECIES: zinc-binding alcohol dehydrogenase family protein [Bacteroidaceae]|jgi:threonine dehydrogenase-like Zn-dependent dehydrogenase|uniref:Sorbitol dehydrogenase n=1 Tax=Bacteroides xylanisolvens TaxID=371601 RepID=A0A415KQH4_9BACE|nr:MULTISPECIES: zinc-binding alcohol dehydrogenase family protein [Bacteroidaceae]RGZ54340.1 sorbitol dehydrogenase [Phocaeicola plebeius]RHD26358.1 sorbitol dehydrogenase [Bacteroides stercoris]RHJ61812.1 sorbitol dehydrogenase [Phocaeicola plebeius]RHL38501.1 sorbitol dehydrogenase [Bacteroides xylanisolvens]RJV42821.1 sorbitol dehydrogenase [Bacteroides sp. AF25-38AC]